MLSTSILYSTDRYLPWYKTHTTKSCTITSLLGEYSMHVIQLYRQLEPLGQSFRPPASHHLLGMSCVCICFHWAEAVWKYEVDELSQICIIPDVTALFVSSLCAWPWCFIEILRTFSWLIFWFPYWHQLLVEFATTKPCCVIPHMTAPVLSAYTWSGCFVETTRLIFWFPYWRPFPVESSYNKPSS